jgi:hypothetical protein
VSEPPLLPYFLVALVVVLGVLFGVPELRAWIEAR